MLAMNGKQYLMMGNQAGTVIANKAIGGGGETNRVTNHFSIQGPVDRRTKGRIVAAAARGPSTRAEELVVLKRSSQFPYQPWSVERHHFRTTTPLLVRCRLQG